LRDDDPSIIYPNKWDIVGGHIENDESPIEAVIREKDEEIGPIRIYDLLYLRQITLKEEFNGRMFDTRLSLFHAKTIVSIEEMCLGDEGQAINYFSLDQILNINTVPFIKEYIRQNRNELDRS